MCRLPYSLHAFVNEDHTNDRYIAGVPEGEICAPLDLPEIALTSLERPSVYRRRNGAPAQFQQHPCGGRHALRFTAPHDEVTLVQTHRKRSELQRRGAVAEHAGDDDFVTRVALADIFALRVGIAAE